MYSCASRVARRQAENNAYIEREQFASAMAAVRSVIARSPVPEDPGHADNTLCWLLRIAPQADPALRMAALAHDIERARPDRLRRDAFCDYDAFKAAHARISAAMADALMLDAGLGAALRKDIAQLIARHETGGDARSDLIKDADSLSYFDHNLPFYFRREGWAASLQRARWGYNRLSPRALRFYTGICHRSHVLNTLLREAARQGGTPVAERP